MTLLERLQAMPTQGVALPFRGFIRYRESRPHDKAGQSDQAPLIVLHGIGSGSGSWLHQLTDERLGRVLAWDAPGYADSSPLKMQEPAAADYAQVLWAWLDALNIQEAHLVGHSLGCIMAAAAARLQPQRVKKLTLLAPAQGYGTAPESVRIQKRDERLQAMAQLGLQKMAEQRAPRLLSPAASAEQIELATHMMSRLNEGGYTQATHMLSTADIRADLQAFKQQSAAPIQVACGDQDVITPPSACEELARFMQAPYTLLPGAGHLCALQVPQAIHPLLLS
jgi:pimeloyl-ACP methyl ester carboxylesterase